MHRRVVHEMPDEDADPAVAALIDLRGLNDLLLQGRGDPPVHHVARVLILVGAGHEASVVRPQAGGEHAGAPGPPGGHEILVALVKAHDVQAGVVSLFFTSFWAKRPMRSLEKLAFQHVSSPFSL